MLGEIPRKVKAPRIENTRILNIPNNRDIRIQFCNEPDGEYLVETIGAYKIVVKKPNSLKVKGKLPGCKNQRDFTIWVFEDDKGYWMPTHLKTLQAFYKLSSSDKLSLFNSIRDVVINYVEPVKSCKSNGCETIFLVRYPALLVISYIKWMAVLEDTIYPPPK